jgi:hypothetical protein
MRQSALKRSDNIQDTWPGLVDVIIATMMILLLFMIIQYIMFFLSDAVKRIGASSPTGAIGAVDRRAGICRKNIEG